MGCDIHGYVEAQLFAQNKISDDWYPVINAENILGRNYDMFAKLFGVRLETVEQRSGQKVIPIAAQRGLPEYGRYQKDSPNGTVKEYNEWEGDAHSATWITLKELRGAIQDNGNFSDDRLEVLLDMMLELIKLYGEDSIRLVVWFDN